MIFRLGASGFGTGLSSQPYCFCKTADHCQYHARSRSDETGTGTNLDAIIVSPERPSEAVVIVVVVAAVDEKDGRV